MSSFKLNDYVVYPGYGVGIVSNILEKEIKNEKKTFLEIKINLSNLKLLIPIDNNDLGLRKLSSKKEAEEILNVLRVENNFKIGQKTWNRRYRDFMEKIKEGSLQKISEVYKELVSIKKIKELSFGEKKILEMVRSLLLTELSLIEGLNKMYINDLFGVANGK